MRELPPNGKRRTKRPGAPLAMWERFVARLTGSRRTTPLPADPSSGSVARSFVRRVLFEWDLTAMEPDASLVATELVTNGLRHGGGTDSISITATGRHLRIAVADRAHQRPPRREYRELTAEGGRGIAIVEGVADAWGTTRLRLHRGKSVWCELKI